MKKALFSLIPALVLFFTACDDSSYEQHQTTAPGMMGLYADQTQLNFPIISLDSWTANLSSDWLSMSPTSKTVTQGTTLRYDTTYVALTASSCNTTGATRKATIGISANDYLSIPVYQYYWLNISSPSAVYTNSSNPSVLLEDVKVVFPLSLTATAADTAIVFTTYQTNATLASDADWLTPTTTEFAAKGQHTARFTVTANTTGEARTGNLRLTSGGVSTDVVVTQGK